MLGVCPQFCAGDLNGSPGRADAEWLCFCFVTPISLPACTVQDPGLLEIGMPSSDFLSFVMFSAFLQIRGEVHSEDSTICNI